VNFWKRWIGSIQKKTAQLSLSEMGAYDRLLDHYYAHERPLPPDVERCCRIAGAATRDERKAVAAVLAEFFTLSVEGYTQERAAQEISEAQPKIASARTNGSKGGRPLGSLNKPKDKPSGFPVGTQTESSTETETETKKEKGAQCGPMQVCAPSEAVESEGDQPTPAGLACRAIRAAGIDIPGPTADLNRLVNAGVPPEEFGAVAAELVARGKGRVPLLLSTIEGRRQDAQAKGGVAAAVPVTTDPNEAIQARGASVCVGRWASGTLGDYRERVEAAERAQQGSALASVHDLAARMKA